MYKQEKLNVKQIKSSNDLFRYDNIGKNKKVVHVNILDEVYEGKSISNYLKELEEANSLIKASKTLLISILNTNGYKVKDTDLKSLLEQLKKVQIVNPHSKYLDVTVKNGYAVGKKDIEGLIVKHNGHNINISNGCFEVVDNKLVLDKQKLKRKAFNL
jgi:hypothetical protein